jgi:CRP-like cAMP-binding protein
MNSTLTLRTNRLLDTLPAGELAYLLTATEAVVLPVRTILYEPGIRPKYAYFLTDGIASIVRNTANGSVVEVGIIGREGLVGAIHLLGPLELPTQSFMQMAGTGRRILFADLVKIFVLAPSVHGRISEFIQFRVINACQLAACNATHSIEQRLARWLLNIQDRLLEERFALTHEFLAEMLAVQRPTLSIVAKQFQVAGVIAYRHGQMQILQRHALEALACDCYEICHSLLTDLYSHSGESNPSTSNPPTIPGFVASSLN